jgi:hypothetical protein
MKKYVSWIVLFVIIILASFIYWKYIFTYSDGYRAGLLQKFSRKGNVFKTYEGEMILSSVRSNLNVALASEKFLFSVKDKPVALKLEQIQGEFIIVHYKEKNGILPWRGETTYLVDSVKIGNAADIYPPGVR